MLVTQQPVFRRFWYPVMPLQALSAGPKAFELLGEPLVLWLDEQGKAAAVRDRCCHRTAKLSLGKVEQGRICCPYHGWEFGTDGTCKHVPQLKDGQKIPATYCVDAYHCAERYGYAWICLEDPIIDIPAIDEASDEKLITCLSMICPFEPQEKQALLEADCCNARADLFMTMLDIAVQSGDSNAQTQH